MKILVPVDGSKPSMEALKTAADYAKAKNAETYIMTVIPYVSDVDLELSASERDKILESMRRRGEDVLEKSKNQMHSLGVSKVNTILSTSTSVAQEIVNLAEKEKVSLIVIGSKGMGATARFLLGSVASKVVRHSHCSVHVVRE